MSRMQVALSSGLGVKGSPRGSAPDVPREVSFSGLFLRGKGQITSSYQLQAWDGDKTSCMLPAPPLATPRHPLPEGQATADPPVRCGNRSPLGAAEADTQTRAALPRANFS